MKLGEAIILAVIPKEYIIPDERIDVVWRDANFGEDKDKHLLILSTLLQIGGGYAVGHTAMRICRELKLLTPKSNSREARLTKTGKRVMYHWNKVVNDQCRALRQGLEATRELWDIDCPDSKEDEVVGWYGDREMTTKFKDVRKLKRALGDAHDE